MNMEIRKIQITGGASFIISLPKHWAKRFDIKKNDKVGIIERSDGSLLIIPKISGKHAQKVKEFDVSNITDSSYMFRLLLGAYIVGYNIIIIKSKSRLTPLVRETVRNFIKATIGVEIIEETSNSITIKDFLDPTELPFEKAIKRIVSIVNSMHEDILIALSDRDVELFRDIIARDDDVDRLNWLISRQYNILSRNSLTTEKVNMVNYSLISRVVERIGDHAVRIAKNSINLLASLDKEIIDTIVSAGNTAIRVFNNSIQSFFSKDLRKANESIEAVAEIVDECERIYNIALQQKGAIAISLGYIEESIRRTGEYSGDLAEYVINYLIE